MKVAICGGGLQGAEAAYLALLAGWESLVIDRRAGCPAAGLAGRFVQEDLMEAGQLNRLLAGFDLILPACENAPFLKLLTEWGRAAGRPVAFCWPAYQISSSKIKSKEIFRQTATPTPGDWPKAGYPLVIKPESASGSKGVKVLNGPDDWPAAWPSASPPAGWLVEEYCPGPSYSLEVTGRPGRYRCWQTTEIVLDETCDCRGVLAPAGLAPDHEAELRRLAQGLAEAVGLVGLMDVEAILTPRGFRVLEIDARLPSQTPSAVYWSTGLNFLKVLAGIFLNDEALGYPAYQPGPGDQAVILEHVLADRGWLYWRGEHIMTGGGPLTRRPGLWGADDVLTGWRPGLETWTATLICRGRNPELARAKMDRAAAELKAAVFG